MKNTCLRYTDKYYGYSPFGSLLSWYVGDKHAHRIGWLIDIYCKLFRIDPKRFHKQYPT